MNSSSNLQETIIKVVSFIHPLKHFSSKNETQAGASYPKLTQIISSPACKLAPTRTDQSKHTSMASSTVCGEIPQGAYLSTVEKATIRRSSRSVLVPAVCNLPVLSDKGAGTLFNAIVLTPQPAPTIIIRGINE